MVKNKKGGSSRSSSSESRKRRSSRRRSSRSRSSRSRSRKKKWSSKDSICPKGKDHNQIPLSREGRDARWKKVSIMDLIVNTTKLNIDTGVYDFVIFKPDEGYIYLLKRYNHLEERGDVIYPEMTKEGIIPFIGHSSIFSEKEYDLEWKKEEIARDFSIQAEKAKGKEKKRLLKLEKRAREQCLIYYAGSIYYDEGIVLWTNKSGHFQPNIKNSRKVGLPIGAFYPYIPGVNEKDQKYWKIIEKHLSLKRGHF